MKRKLPPPAPTTDLCCPECLSELFRMSEDGQVRCADCGLEVENKRDKKDVKIH